MHLSLNEVVVVLLGQSFSIWVAWLIHHRQDQERNRLIRENNRLLAEIRDRLPFKG